MSGQENPGGATSHGLEVGMLVAGRYRVLNHIDDGSTGMIYRVRDERLRIHVALKLLRPESSSDERKVKRFEQELVLGRQVSHPNVVRIHDIWQDGALHFLTMDLVEGQSLRQLLRERGALAPDMAVRIARDLASALAAAHSKAVVHRDLKPANVLIDRDGRARITDFGIARSLGQSPLGEGGMVVGTLDYISPEQARGGEVDGRSDIYALGIILYEMLVGKLPYPGTTPEQVVLARAFGAQPSLSRAGVVVPAWIEEIVKRCLAADPDDRYSDATQLERALAAGPASSRPSHKGVIGAGLAAALAIAAVCTLYFTRAPLEASGVLTSVAVLPLDDQSAHRDAGWLATGLAEMLTQGLAEGTNLQVADRLRVIQTFENLHLDPGALGPDELRRLADLLDVERLATGSVREAGGSLRVELRLLDPTAPGRPLKILRRDGNLPGLFQLADGLSRDLQLALTGRTAANLPPPMSTDEIAVQAFSEGLQRLSRDDAVGAAPAFTRAIKRDPGFAAAWVRLAESHEHLGHDEEALAAAREATRQLVDHPGRLALEASARVAALSGNLGRAQQDLTTLVTRYPRDAGARVMLAQAYGEQGQLDRAQRELRIVTAANPDHPSAWYLLGKYAILAGDYRAAADDYLVHALVIDNRLGNIAGSGDVENALGIAQFSLGKPEAARQRYENAIELRRQIGDERGVAASTANLARIDLAGGQFGPARLGLQGALAIVERIGDRQTIANLHNELGSLEEQEGHFGEALKRYRRALVIFRETGDERAVAESCNSVGFTYYVLGDFENAAVYAEQAIQLYERSGNREGRMFTNQTLGQLALVRGDWRGAEEAFLDMLKLGREFENGMVEAVAHGQLARTAYYEGRFTAAQKSVRSGFSALEPAPDARGIAELALIEAEIALEVGMLEESGRSLAKVEELLEASGSREQRAEWLRLSGLRKLRSGDIPAARRLFDAAILLANEGGIAATRLAAEIDAAEASLKAGDAKGAAAALKLSYEAARSMGHLPLELQSAEMLARAQSQAGRDAAAEEHLRVALSKVNRHTPWGGSYRLHAHLANVLRQAGRVEEADDQLQDAVEELVRLRRGFAPPMRASFDVLEVVRSIDVRPEPIQTAFANGELIALSR